MVEINNLTKSKIDVAALKKLAEKVLREEKTKASSLSVALVTPKKSAALNKEYRKKDGPANVLSFEGEGSELGEIVLCPQKIRQDARQYAMIFEDALAWMLVHGILHVLGYDHKTAREANRMESKERSYLKVSLPNE